MDHWKHLQDLRDGQSDMSIAGLFEADPKRFETFSITLGDMILDLSKTMLTDEVVNGLVGLAEARDVAARRDAMFAGEKINETEGRAVLHTALRAGADAEIIVDGQDVMPEVRATLTRMAAFCDAVRAGEQTNAQGEAFTDAVNIGIGGSDLGPAMAAQAMAPFCDGPRAHFVSNIDGAHIDGVLAGLDPTRTLVIVASKTLTTAETMTNAETARKWLLSAVAEDDLTRHLVGLTSAEERGIAFGIAPERMFGFEDWVGGRYSVWGPIGLSLMLAMGPARFGDFLAGARAMDDHFRTAPLRANMPMMLALLGIWHNNICGYDTRAVLPYDQRLARLPAYLQQLDMESNGKGVDLAGQAVARDTGPVVWGEPGTNGQHAFYQLIHQGTRVIPAEFLVARHGHEPDLAHHHRMLLANCLAQAEALMVGRTLDRARALIADKGFEPDELERQAAQRVFSGNRPSTILMYDNLDPATLGKIIALYEHRVFVEGVIWGINSFDQWGVELGKELANSLLPVLEGEADAEGRDGSTKGLIATLK